MYELANNVRRLLGLHAMRATRDSRAIDGLSPQALSELQAGTRTSPSLATVAKIAEFFEIPIDRLLKAPFAELLETDLASSKRFDAVERKLQRKPPPRSTRSR